jgi:hypothetical protein
MHTENDLFSITDSGSFDEFLVTLTGADNHWMFISSRGALTAGREDAEHALFPYGTVDKVYASRGNTGPRSFIRDPESGKIWEPFADWSAFQYATERRISKNREGTTIVFEETNRDLELAFSYSWAFSSRYGFVRQVRLANLSNRSRSIFVLDGLMNILCPGISNHLQTELSCLTEAYKDNVVDPVSGMAIFSLASLVTDKAMPAEGLGASVAWFKTGTPAELSLDGKAISDFTSGKPFISCLRACGKRGDFFAHMEMRIAGDSEESWLVCADRDLDAARVRSLSREIAVMESTEPVLDDVEQNRLKLQSLVADSDGMCSSTLRMHEWHHFANVLFNSLRGGVPLNGYAVRREDLLGYVRTRNAKAAIEAERQIPAGGLTISNLRRLASGCAAAGQRDLARHLEEYLPLGFSRRHGDPSRPWNRFSIKIRDENGNPACAYQGNWRDIFQNWEALSVSWPGYLPGFIAAFLNATTLDGYNPYRIGRDGLEWEKPDPDNPWANIGYWNDHQIIYAQKLFERLNESFPGALEEGLGSRKYSYAAVPYRIAGFDATCRNPRSTISFDARLDKEIAERVKTEGTDARLVRDDAGAVYHATLAEKILTIALPKIANLVPGGGVWINTQRPEWNDANNALVGTGLSVVTLAYLRRFLAFWTETLEPLGGKGFAVAGDVADFAASVRATLDGPGTENPESDPASRFSFMREMGKASDRYRAGIYANMRFARPSVELTAAEIAALFHRAIAAIDRTLDRQKREDGLFHSYNLLSLGSSRAGVTHLQPMLEGQVAVLSSGYLRAEAATELLEALPSSGLYRANKNSYMLYPAKALPDFLAKNAFPEAKARSIPLLARLLDARERTLVTASGDGNAHFGMTMENADAVSAALDAYERKNEWKESARASRRAVLDLYESTFNHASFTGRSGTMYAYEGIGSIYWHMVSKLLLASGELFVSLRDVSFRDAEAIERVRRAYLSIRDGLGYRRGADDYGAFPWDPYSHTPAGAFARQPGMTGQVKEEILTRLIECGLEVRRGEIVFSDAPLMSEEAIGEAAAPRLWRPFENGTEIRIEAKEFGFTFCGIPIARSTAKPSSIILERDSAKETIEGAVIGRELSERIFFRESGIRSIRLE